MTVYHGNITKVSLPENLRLGPGSVLENKGIEVKASEEVVVYGINKATKSTDAFMCLPVDIWGTEYFVPSWPKQARYKGPQMGKLYVCLCLMCSVMAFSC